ncbi:MAG TPA: GWxTD domain-containing protein, partial [Chthoniobacterales bacterium]
RRIAYANATFGGGSNSEGWRTDRGRTYITLGPPQQKELHLNAANLFPFEIWFYSGGQPALPPFFYVMFYQHEGIGDFRFYSPYIDGPDKLVTGTEAINDRQGALKIISDSVGGEVARRTLSLLPDEPVDMTNATASLQSDVMLATLRNLANNPITKRELDKLRGALESVTSRLVLAGQTLDVATLPIRDSRGLPRVDYMMRFRNPSDFSLTDRGDGKYSYSVEARVRVFDADGKLLFTQLKTVADTLDRGQVADIKEKRFGYEGSLPLPPGKYHLDFLLTDWQKKAAFQAEKDVVVPPVGENDFVISGVLPFSQAAPADPATADVTPFALAGVKFTPLGTAPLILSPADSLQVAYQIWTAPKDPRAYAGSVLNVEYALGRPAVPGGATLVTDQVNKEQFDPAGSLVNGKRFSLDAESTGNYMLTVTVKQGATSGPAFTSLNFSVLGNAPAIGVWDISDPSLQKDLQTGLADQDRALCYLAQGKKDEARVWFRRALDRDRTNDVARARLVDAYYARKDYGAVISLY